MGYLLHTGILLMWWSCEWLEVLCYIQIKSFNSSCNWKSFTLLIIQGNDRNYMLPQVEFQHNEVLFGNSQTISDPSLFSQRLHIYFSKIFTVCSLYFYVIFINICSSPQNCRLCGDRDHVCLAHNCMPSTYQTLAVSSHSKDICWMNSVYTSRICLNDVI